ncbi:MAG: CBS domain-containing protein [Actinomycetota bacterium]
MTRTVADVMTRTVVVVPGSAPFKQIVRAMREYRVSAVPVTDPDGLIAGVVSEADLMLREDPSVLEPHFFEGRTRREERRKAEAFVARDLMTAPAVTIGPQATVDDAARLMHERGVKRLPVVDLDGRIVGIVSRMDLLAEFLRDDDDIRTEVVRVLVDDLGLPPEAVLVLVDDGVVHVEGRIERRSMVPAIWASVRDVPGVVGLDERLTWELDDTIAPVSPVPWVGF